MKHLRVTWQHIRIGLNRSQPLRKNSSECLNLRASFTLPQQHVLHDIGPCLHMQATRAALPSVPLPSVSLFSAQFLGLPRLASRQCSLSEDLRPVGLAGDTHTTEKECTGGMEAACSSAMLLEPLLQLCCMGLTSQLLSLNSKALY